MKPCDPPSPVYGCADDGCASEISYPADMLFWCERGWFCLECAYRHELDRGISLEGFLRKQKVDDAYIDADTPRGDCLKHLVATLTVDQKEALRTVINTAAPEGDYIFDGDDSVWTDDVGLTLAVLANEITGDPDA